MTMPMTTQDILRQIAAEMDQLCQLVHAVELVLPAALAQSPPPTDSRTVTALQGLDLLAQSLVALAQFLRHVDPDHPASTISIEGALRHIPLQDLADRLRHPTARDGPQVQWPHPAPAIELF